MRPSLLAPVPLWQQMFLPRPYLVLAAIAVIGCTDSATEVVRSSTPALNSSAAYDGEFDLGYDFLTPAFHFGLYPQHPAVTLPPGEYDFKIEVTGGITWQETSLKTILWAGDRFVGPGGTMTGAAPHYGDSARVFQVFLIREEANGFQRTVWSAPPVEGDRAEGNVRVQGGARFYVVRYSPGASSPLVYDFRLWYLLPYYPRSALWSSNQRVRLVATRVEADPPLQVSCAPNPVRRGEEIACTASAGQAKLEIESWNFSGVDSRGSAFAAPTDGVTITDNPWKGVMVMGGTVSVRARVNGGNVTERSATITVAGRDDWGVRSPGYTFLPAPETETRIALPAIVRWAKDLGAANWFQSETPASVIPDYTSDVVGGPNDGANYFGEETTVRVFGYYSLNRAAMESRSGFYAAQERRGMGGTQLGGMNWCPPSVVTSQLPALVRDHELGHGNAYRDALHREFRPVITRLEETTSADVGDLYDAYQQAWVELDKIARAESRAFHSKPGGLLEPLYNGTPCALKNEQGNILENELDQ